MAPPFRDQLLQKNRTHRKGFQQKRPRDAAVMLLCYPKNEQAHLVLILRPTYQGVHSDQVALPGGKVEADDPDFEFAALRETHEEIGVSSSAIEICCAMTKIYVPPSNYWVHPFLGMAETTPIFTPQPSEVARVIEIPFDVLMDEACVQEHRVSTSYAKEVLVPAFNLEGYVVWGATAMMLQELKMMVKRFMPFWILYLCSSTLPVC